MSNASSSSPQIQEAKSVTPIKYQADLGRPLRALSVTILIYLAIQVVLLIAGLILIVIYHDKNYSIDNSAAAEFLSILIAEALTVGIVLNILKRRHLGLSAIGLGRRPVIGDLGRGLLAFGAFFLIFLVVALIISALSPSISNGKQDVGFTHLKSQTDNILAFIALVILPPLGEETLFRGYFYSALRHYWKFWPAALATSLLFGSAHLLTGDTGLLWIAGIETFILSIVLVYLREKTGALYAGMLVHMLNNLIAFFVIIR